ACFVAVDLSRRPENAFVAADFSPRPANRGLKSAATAWSRLWSLVHCIIANGASNGNGTTHNLVKVDATGQPIEPRRSARADFTARFYSGNQAGPGSRRDHQHVRAKLVEAIGGCVAAGPGHAQRGLSRLATRRHPAHRADSAVGRRAIGRQVSAPE